MNKKEWINLIIIIFLLSFSYYRFKNRTFNFSQIQIVMDTQVEIFAVSHSSNIDRLVLQAFDLIRQYDNKFSYYNENSRLYAINNTDEEIYQIDNDFYTILSVAQQIYHKSNNLYDISIANLIDVWDFENGIVPNYLEIQDAINNTGFDKISFTDTTLSIPNNIKLNFGSIAKGFIIDKAIDFLIANGVKEAYINAGGDLKFYSGNKKKWRVGIQHPRDKKQVIISFQIPDMAVVTSGDYERYFIFNNQRYHHIINPKTGYPSDESISVTVFSKDAMLADALSTAALLMNPFDAIEMIKKFPDNEAIIYFFDENNNPTSLKTIGMKKWNSFP